MVGIKVNGCDPCRKKKIKCDRQTPICGRCTKARNSREECIYPERFKFVGRDQATPSETQTTLSHRTKPARQVVVYTGTSDTAAEGGGLFQKWHRIRMDAAPTVEVPLAEDERIRRDIVRCFKEGASGIGTHRLGEWMEMVPARIGRSKALDDAIQLFASAHHSLCHGQPVDIDGPMYFKAIRSLRLALASPSEGYSSETLAATAILYFLEAVFGSAVNLLHHSGGLARMLEVRGPVKSSSEFENFLVSRLVGIAIGRAIHLGVPCYLSAEPWRSFLAKPRHESRLALTEQLLYQMIDWTDFTIGMRNFRKGNLSQAAAISLRHQITQNQASIKPLSAKLEDFFSSPDQVWEVKSIRTNDTMFDRVIEYADSHFASTLVLHDAYAIILNRMLTVLSENDILQDDEATLERRSVQNLKCVMRILRSYEFAWKRRPLGALIMLTPLMVAYLEAETEELQDWIIDALNELDSHHSFDQPRFCKTSTLYMAKVMLGQVDAPWQHLDYLTKKEVMKSGRVLDLDDIQAQQQ